MQVRSSADTLGILRALYDVASIVQLSVRVDDGWSNVCKAMIRGNRALRRTLGPSKRTEIQVRNRLFALTWADVDTTQADEFIADASLGAATLPNTNVSVKYSLAEPDIGSWGKPAPPNFQGTPLLRRCWARSFPAAGYIAGFELLVASTAARVADQLPQRYPFPFGIVDVRMQLAQIGSFIDLYPSYP